MNLKLRHYSALAAAFIAMKSEVNAQIVYTDIPDDTLGFHGKYDLDLNNDGKTDFEISLNAKSSGSYCSIFTSVQSAIVTPESQNQIVGANNFAFAFQCGNEIDESSPWASKETDLWTYSKFQRCSSCDERSCFFATGSKGSWINVKDRYLGLKVIDGKDTLYGWIRMDANINGSIIIKDYAYESSPGTSILAGNLPCADYKLEALPAGPLKVCPSSGFRFSVQNNCATFQWYRNGLPIQGADSNEYVADTTGLYYVVGQTEYGCVDTSNTAQVITLPTPPKPSVTRDVDTLISTSADKYQWLYYGFPITGATNQKYVPDENSESYAVSTAYKSGICYTASDNVSFVTCDLLNKHLYGGLNLDALAANSSLCKNDIIELAGSFYGFYPEWFINDSMIIQGSSYCNFIRSGLYYCQLEGFDTTCVSDSSNISLLALNVSRQGDTLISSPADEYQWLFNGSQILAATNQSYVVRTTGNYIVEATFLNKCFITSQSIFVDITAVQGFTNHILPEVLKISPKLVQIQFFNSDFLHGKIKIINALGQTVREVSIGSNTMQIPFSEDESGWFVLDIEKDEHRYFSPVIIF